MIPIWVFLVTLVVFGGILFNEYKDKKELKDDIETLKFYLDQYVIKYGPTIPVTLIQEGDEIKNSDIKQ